MKDPSTTKQDLVEENGILKQIIQELQTSGADRKKVEEELFISKNRLSRAEIVSRCGHWEFDFGSKMVFASEGARRIYGIPDRGWTVHEVQTIPLPEYRPMLDDALQGLIEENRPYSVEYKIRRPDTGEIVDIHSVAEYDPHKNVVFGIIQDITERKQAEEALKKEKETLHTVLENYPSGLALISPDGIYQYVNPEFTRITGYNLQDIPSGREWLQKAYPDPAYRKMAVDAWKQDGLSYAGAVVDREFAITRGDGKTRVVNIRTTFMKDFSITVLNDITERKRAEEALRESEVKHRRIFESLEDVYFQADNEGMIQILSPSIERIVGGSPDELIGRPITEFYMEPSGRETILSLLAKNGYVRDYDVALKRKDGRLIQASISSQLLFDCDGRPEGMAGTLRDITDRKMAEETLQYETAFLDAVINCSQEGIYLLDVERQKVLENQRARDLWKMTEDVDDDEARVMHMIRSLKDAGPFREKLMYLRAHPQDSVQVELELKDGTVLDCHSSPIISKSGKTYGRLWTFRDITELRHTAQMLEKLSGTDALTSLANRRQFDEVLQREWQRAIRNQSSISLIMVDIDLFKAYNDRYGHPIGDECLRRVALAIAQATHRPSDLSARYGGEEFACILPDTNLRGALVVARKILDSVRALNIPHLSSRVAGHVTVSAGAAALIPTDGQPLSQLIETADMLLYQAKQSGRNQVRSECQEEAEQYSNCDQPMAPESSR